MPVFTPPTDNIVPPTYQYEPDPYAPCDPLMRRLFRHYASGPRGRNVFRLADGTITEAQPANWDPNDPTGPSSTSWYQGAPTTTSPDQVVAAVYWGGHANPITAAEATVLTAAGYGAFIT